MDIAHHPPSRWLVGAALLAALIAAPAVAEPIDAPLTLDTAIRMAIEGNPDLAELRARTRSAETRVDAAGRLPDIALDYQQWGVPLERPWALNDADMLMLGLNRSFPAGLGERKNEARAEARLSEQAAATRALDVIAEVRRTYADYLRLDLEARVQRELAALLESLTDLARSQYRAGTIGQQDVLRLGVDQSNIRTRLVTLEQERRTVAARLNTLLGRTADAPIGRPVEPAHTDIDVPAQVDDAVEKRPEVLAAQATIDRGRASLAAVQAENNRPEFMVGASYMYSPMPMGVEASKSPHGYMLMLGMTLPWLSGGRDAEEAAAREAIVADEAALTSARLTARYQVEAATAQVEAARRTLDILDREVLPQATAAYESARASFTSGRESAIGLLDSVRSLLSVRLDRVRASAQLLVSRAELDRALGRLPENLEKETLQ